MEYDKNGKVIFSSIKEKDVDELKRMYLEYKINFEDKLKEYAELYKTCKDIDKFPKYLISFHNDYRTLSTNILHLRDELDEALKEYEDNDFFSVEYSLYNTNNDEEELELELCITSKKLNESTENLNVFKMFLDDCINGGYYPQRIRATKDLVSGKIDYKSFDYVRSIS